MEEEFRPIKDFERYYVSNLGRVLNSETGKILKMSQSEKGYLFVGLRNNRKSRFFRVHRLVAQEFIPNTDNLDTVDHINGVKTDNRVENLRWLSRHDNTSRFYREQMTEKWKEHLQKPVICLETGKIYESTTQASKELNISNACICINLRGKTSQTHGLHFRYLLEDNDYE